ncbi:hypothetical protein AVEN_172735-1 [Araneus ventricosus]|uniref:DUF4371 domain-containing protein n=1 Tax=Araneus ventricosus TaxID=182803 RepID=A0A4Y2BJM3_ARAVE|nr:hypothetical protein AVEN_172735-1 [Araneus ventricosus]
MQQLDVVLTQQVVEVQSSELTFYSEYLVMKGRTRKTAFDGRVSLNGKPDRSICLNNVINKHFEFACRACMGNEQALDPDCTCQPSGVTERFRISYGQIWRALSHLDCSDNIQKRLGLAHISVIREPGGQYVGHVTPANGTGSDITKCILKYVEDNDVDINELEATGCDGTATNTGWKNGVIATQSLKFSARCSVSYAYFTSTSYHSNIHLNIWTERQWDQSHFLGK